MNDRTMPAEYKSTGAITFQAMFGFHPSLLAYPELIDKKPAAATLMGPAVFCEFCGRGACAVCGQGVTQ